MLKNLLQEVKKFNQEVEEIRLQKGQKISENQRKRIKEGRVLPPLLRSLQLLLQRPEARVIIRPKIPGILLETQEDKAGRKSLKFGLQKRNPRKNPKLPEDSQMRCDILRQFGIMWLAPFCHLSPLNTFN